MSNHNDLVQENLHRLFYPESVAVIGTNNVKGTVPYDILENILKAELRGVVYPVSPREKHIANITTIYTTIGPRRISSKWPPEA